MMGLVSQLAQVVMLRELLMLFHGNELSIGIILSAWMAWVGLGSGIGALLAARTERALALMALNAMALLPVLAASVLFTRGLRGLFDLVPGAYLPLADIILSSLLVLAPVGVLIGMQFVLLARLWRQHDRRTDTSGAGKTYIGEAVGNICGGVAFSLLLVHALNPLQIMVAAGILVAAAVLWAGRAGSEFSSHLTRPGRLALLGLVLVAAAVWPFLERIDQAAHALQWRQLAPHHELKDIRQSKHGNIAVTRRDDQLSFFRSGHLMFAAAGPETRSPHFEQQEAAVFAHFALTRHPHPRRVLLIGGGLRGTLTEVLRHPVEQVDYVELDEVLTAAARDHLGSETLAALAADRVRLVHRDGRLFIKEAREHWDVILVDVPDPATAVLNRYYTREFFLEAGRRLGEGGLLVINAVSTPGLRGQAVANRNATLRHSLAESFEHVEAAGQQFLIFVAGNEETALPVGPDLLAQRFVDRRIDSPAFSPGHFRLLLEPGQQARVNWILLHHGRHPRAHLEPPPSPPLAALRADAPTMAPEEPLARRFFINSDFRPIGYFHTLLFWGELTGSETAAQLGRLMSIRPVWVLAPVLAVLLATLLLRMLSRARPSSPDRRLAVGLAVFTTGLATMAMQIGLLFAFQSVYGFIYEMVGLIVALFMAGLATGTTITQVGIHDRANLGWLAVVQGVIALFALLIALCLPISAELPSGPWVFAFFAALTFLGGLLNGIDFPLATEAFRSINQRAERSTGLVYGIELLGACLGAALASVLIAPIMGIMACFLFAAIVNGTALAVLLIARRSHDV